jgi:uncharacterized protein
MSEEQKTAPVITVEPTKTEEPKIEEVKTETKSQASTTVSQETKIYAIVAHLGGLIFGLLPLGGLLGFVPSLVIMLAKKDDKFVEEEAKEALNFQITLAIGYLVSIVLMLIFIGFILWYIVYIINIVFAIIAAISVGDSKNYKYPVCLRLIK